MQASSTGSRGFTLIELLVVVVIISVLSAIAMPQYFKLVERARLIEVTAMLGSLRSAQERALARDGSYVTTNADMNSFDINLRGQDPTYGMKNYFLVFGPGSQLGCQPGTPFFNVLFIRITNNAGVSPRYFDNYSVLYERCTDTVSFPGCPNCVEDFTR